MADEESTATKLEKLREQLKAEERLKEGLEKMTALYGNYSNQNDGIQKNQETLKSQLEMSKTKIDAIKRQMESLANFVESKDFPSTSKKRQPGIINRKLTLRKQTKDAESLNNMKKSNTVSSFGSSNAKSDSSSLDPSRFLGGERSIVSNRSFAIDKDDGDDFVTESCKVLREPLERDYNKFKTLVKLTEFISKCPSFESQTNPLELVKSSRFCLLSNVKELRAVTFRFYRQLVMRNGFSKHLFLAHVDIFLYRSICLDITDDIERVQALKLIHCIIETKEGVTFLPKSMVSLLLSVSENQEDKLRVYALLILSEICIRNPCLASYCGAIKSIIQTLSDGPKSFESSALLALNFLLLNHETRKYIRPGVEIETLLYPFSDAYSKGTNHEETLAQASKIVMKMMQSWSGLFCFCMDGKTTLKALVQSLYLENDSIRKTTISLIFHLLKLGEDSFEIKNYDRISAVAKDVSSSRIVKRQSLIDIYQSYLLMLMLEVGLIEALVNLAEKGIKDSSLKCTILLGEILNMCNILLPKSYIVKVQTLPKLFESAANFVKYSCRHQSITALTLIDSITRWRELERSSVDMHKILKKGLLRHDNNIPIRGKSYNESVKQRLGVQMDDARVKTLLADSQVLAGRDFTGWNWDAILELLQGPMLNPKRMDETLRTTKFFKRLLSFLRPFKRNFVEIRSSKVSQKYVRAGDAIIKTLVSQPEGIRYLMENRFLPEIAESLERLDPIHGGIPANHAFSDDNIESGVSSEYFTFLGTISKSPDGNRLLERFGIYSKLYKVSELRSREKLVQSYISKADYSSETHARLILEKVLTGGHKNLRVFATKHLKTLLKESSNIEFSEWCIGLLLNQIYDCALEVCEVAVSAMTEACDDNDNLRIFISLNPCLDHLGSLAESLLIKFFALPEGFDYLQKIDFVFPEMNRWITSGNLEYVINMELAVEQIYQCNYDISHLRALDFGSKFSLQKSNNGGLSFDSLYDRGGFDEKIKMHFFGELTKTDEGCQMLKEKGYFDNFYSSIQKLSEFKDSDDSSLTLNLKSVLWAVAHVGSHERGLMEFYGDGAIVSEYLKLIETSSNVSIKATCLYCISLIASSFVGVQMLEERGWESVVFQEFGNFISFPGISLPLSSRTIFQLPFYSFQGSWPRCPLSYYQGSLYLSGNVQDKVVKDILHHVNSLSNHVTFNASLKSLNKLKEEKKEYFRRIDLYLSVQRMVSQYNNGFTFGVRRYIEGLFPDAFVAADNCSEAKYFSGKSDNLLCEIDRLIETVEVVDVEAMQKIELANAAATDGFRLADKTSKVFDSNNSLGSQNNFNNTNNSINNLMAIKSSSVHHLRGSEPMMYRGVGSKRNLNIGGESMEFNGIIGNNKITRLNTSSVTNLARHQQHQQQQQQQNQLGLGSNSTLLQASSGNRGSSSSRPVSFITGFSSPTSTTLNFTTEAGVKISKGFQANLKQK